MKPFSFKRLCVLMMALSLLTVGIVAAQNKSDKQDSNTKTQAQSPQSADKPAAKKQSKKRKKKTSEFKPSEEISEDISVPFPTDI